MSGSRALYLVNISINDYLFICMILLVCVRALLCIQVYTNILRVYQVQNKSPWSSSRFVPNILMSSVVVFSSCGTGFLETGGAQKLSGTSLDSDIDLLPTIYPYLSCCCPLDGLVMWLFSSLPSSSQNQYTVWLLKY